MAKLTRARAEARAAALEAEFTAWRARAEEDEDQDPLALRRLIGRTRGLLRRTRRFADAGGRALSDRIRAQLAAYREAWSDFAGDSGDLELAEIDDLTDALLRGESDAVERLVSGVAGEGGTPDAHAAEVEALGLRASFLLGRYARHFAGRPRASRDAHLLSDLERYLTKMVERLVIELTLHMDDALMERIEVLTDQLAIWAEEQEVIAPTREALPPREQLHALAELCRGLAAEWRVQGGDYPVATVRPKLVKRLVTALDLARIEVESLAATELIDDPEARALVTEVNARLERWREHRARLAEARKRVTPTLRARGLQAEVAECILQWAREVTGGAHDPERIVRMGELCDRLQELERQLERVVRDGANEATARLLAYARARLMEWELAWDKASA